MLDKTSIDSIALLVMQLGNKMKLAGQYKERTDHSDEPNDKKLNKKLMYELEDEANKILEEIKEKLSK